MVSFNAYFARGDGVRIVAVFSQQQFSKFIIQVSHLRSEAGKGNDEETNDWLKGKKAKGGGEAEEEVWRCVRNLFDQSGSGLQHQLQELGLIRLAQRFAVKRPSVVTRSSGFPQQLLIGYQVHHAQKVLATADRNLRNTVIRTRVTNENLNRDRAESGFS